jgi:hypothetical protein
MVRAPRILIRGRQPVFWMIPAIGRAAGSARPDYSLLVDSPSASAVIIKSGSSRYPILTQDTRRKKTRRLRGSGEQHEETTMRKIIAKVFGAALIMVSTAQLAAASERHHVRKLERATTSEPFRNANNAIAAPAQAVWPYSGYSAPAGH